MKSIDTFCINGAWVTPATGGTVMDIVNPASEEAIGRRQGTPPIGRSTGHSRKPWRVLEDSNL
ncbi:hypothetical protein [Cupriavidus necator]|uniref:hypothetical protein n=1 Tax=Cupriavidus necator TaxID=106590 RepID=UPI000992C779|nr:hypothetical protein [Cupriavidus necator]